MIQFLWRIVALIGFICIMVGCSTTSSDVETISPVPTPVSPENNKPIHSDVETVVIDEWAVQLVADASPDDVAREYGAENLGPIGTLSGWYLFKRPQNVSADDPLANDPRVMSLEQQVATQKQPRE